MLVMSVFFLGPFLMGVLSSVKENPNEYPPRLIVPQLTPATIGRAYRLGVAGSGDGWQGGSPTAHREAETAKAHRG